MSLTLSLIAPDEQHVARSWVWLALVWSLTSLVAVVVCIAPPPLASTNNSLFDLRLINHHKLSNSQLYHHQNLTAAQLSLLNRGGGLKPAEPTRLPSMPQESRNLSSSSTSQKPTNPLTSTRLRWRQMEQAIGAQMSSLSQLLRSTLFGLTSSQVSVGCRSALHEFMDGLQQQRLWASQMLDASARLPSGVLTGTLTELGHFDQCLRLRYHANDHNHQVPIVVRGQYCSIQIKPPLVQRARLHTICQRLPPLSSSQLPTMTVAAAAPTNQSLQQQDNSGIKVFKQLADHSQHFYYAGLRLGICTPSQCSRSDIQFLTSAYLSRLELIGQVKSCQVLSDDFQFPNADENMGTVHEMKLDTVQQCIAFTFIMLLALIALGTIIDYATSQPRAPLGEFPTATAGSSASSESLYASFSGRALEPSCNQRGEPTGPAARRWLYQVYRPPRSACALHQQHTQRGPMNLQRNPLAQQQQQDAQFSTLQSCSHLFKEPSELTEEASWLVDLDQSSGQSQVISPASFLGSAIAPTYRSPPLIKTTFVDQELSGGLTSTAKRLLICFSLRANLRAIFVSNLAKSACGAEIGGDVRVIHGLRTVAMIWIIFGHSIGLVNPEMMNNLFSTAQLSCSSRVLQTLLNATLAVNTFFMISGLVTVISLARRCASVRHMLVPRRVKHRGVVGSRVYVDDDGCKSLSDNAIVKKSRSKKQLASGKRDRRRKQRVDSSANHHQPLELTSSALDSSASSTSSIISSLLSSSASSNRCIGPKTTTTTPAANVATTATTTTRARRKRRRIDAIAANVDRWPPSDFKPLVWLLLRYLRLTPTYATVIAASVLFPTLGSGPFWQESATSLSTNCRENWWLNLLYVNNFINTDKLCMIHSWYLSNDWQFFTVTLILVAIFYKSKRLALLLLVICLFASSATNFAVTVANDFPPTIVTTSPAVAERWLFIHSLYYKPWPHLPSYLIGLVTGYLMIRRQQQSHVCHKNPWPNRIAWVTSSSLALALLNSVYPWNMGIQVDPILAGLHSSTFRTLWACCCAWLVYALSDNPHNWLAKTLSWCGFQVSSRLTYCLYLVHPLIIYYHFGTLRERLDLSPYGQFHNFIATLGKSYLAAIVLTLTVESPALKLLRLFANALGVITSNEADTSSNRYFDAGRSSSSRETTQNSWNGSATNYMGDHQSTYGRTKDGGRQSFAMGTESIGSESMRNQNAMPGFQHVKQGAVASLDADFQRRLAQAISRGFRVRSKLANRPAGHVAPRETSGAGSRQTAPLTKWPSAAPPPPPPPAAALVPEHRHVATDKTRKKVEFSTFVIPIPGDQSAVSEQSVCHTPFSAGASNASSSINQQRRRLHQDLMLGLAEQKQEAANLASLNHQILAQHQKLLSRSKDQL